MIDLAKTHDVNSAFKELDLSNIPESDKDSGYNYAMKVLNGEILAGYHIRLACYRHIRDLTRQNSPEFDYHYDSTESEKVIRFASLFTTSEGEVKRIDPMKWQKFVLTQLFGWRDKYNEKRYQDAILSVARHNGKTFLMSVVMVYGILIQTYGQHGLDFLVTSYNTEDTKKLITYIKESMLEMSKRYPMIDDFLDQTGIDKNSLESQSRSVFLHKSGTYLAAPTYNSGHYDGKHYITAIFDEAANPDIKDISKLNRITSGQTRSDTVHDTQFIQISTAYEDSSVPFRRSEIQVIHGIETDDRNVDTSLVLDWSQDSEAEASQPETWMKSNPFLENDNDGKFLFELKKQRSTAITNNTMPDFMHKVMNMWTEAGADSFLKIADIKRCVVPYDDPRYSIDGHDIYMGFDYSMSNDNTAISWTIPLNVDGAQKWLLGSFSWIPWYAAGSIEVKEKQDGEPYRKLAKQGFCAITMHHKGLISADQVYDDITNFIEKHHLNVVFFGYDAKGVNDIIKALDNNTDLPLEPIRQRTEELKDPTKFLQRIFVEGNAILPENPLLIRGLQNAQIYEDSIGIQVSKKAATYKIDAVDALIDSLYQAMYHFEDWGIANDKSKQVERMTDKQVLDWLRNPESGMLDDYDN